MPFASAPPADQLSLPLAGRTAMVTGAARGVGRACCIALARAGANVVLSDLAMDADLRGARQAVAELGRRAGAIAADTGDCTTLEALANRAFAESGAIDILVNCAALPESIAFLDLKRATFEKILRVNVLGPFQLAQACARRWIRDGRSGRIINVALGALGTGHPGKAALGSSAAAVEMLTKKIATELGAHNIIAYCVVLDGQDESDACELGKVAQALAFLASDNARHVNGATFATCHELIAASPIAHA